MQLATFTSSGPRCIHCSSCELQNLIKPCQCKIYAHRECFSKLDAGDQCRQCHIVYQYDYPFTSIHRILSDDNAYFNYFTWTLAICVCFILFCIIYFLQLKSTMEIFYMIIIVCSLASCGIDMKCGLDPNIEGLFNMNPQHIDRFIQSTIYGANVFRQWAMRNCLYYVLDRSTS